MDTGRENFDEIVKRFKRRKGVEVGKMMSSPALKFNNKVFAFFHNERMGFRLGPDFIPKELKIKSIEPLSPFKTKPPLKGWFLVHYKEGANWVSLTDKALQFTRSIK